ncbi:D-hexose-6-phosphate mutarotase [Granulicella tundricola]|uniref:Putative glucose-6-phosphate 1-epimerase n=1 Tax=Granulicella tundricola (strain ATCC BAA-1859 / DSM 23138 / MP5ACTX9) TaxID=1198114 RepID=E8WVV4_GRATM|nr:D-hexose-6-phosphate mutarotase [Granulicella tundricola]ADW70713.1 Aldose 1-epimerase [Granulicella tundricola MP5ACTX9]
MNLTELNDHFGLSGVLTFEDHNGLTRLQVKTPACTATVYLHGAHLTHWQPTGAQPVLFLSDRSDFAPDKAIRGGIPVCFPWFGPRAGGKPGPSHGFARIQPWEVAFAALSGENVHLTLTLGPTALSRSLGFDGFRVAYEMVLGKKLTLRLTVANYGEGMLKYEEALHTYFSIGEVRRTTIAGLESALFVDKTDGLKEKETPPEALILSGQTDRVFPENVSSTTIGDGPRTITINKSNSATTVVWNPWTEGSVTLKDLRPDAWPGFVCVETANTGEDAITLAPNDAHTMQAEITLGKA